MTNRVFLRLKSNGGDRLKQLRRACQNIARLPRTQLVRVFPLYDTTPINRKRQGRSLSCWTQVKTNLTPMGLFWELKRLESEAGRKSGTSPGSPQPLSIDILFWGPKRIKSRWIPPMRPARTFKQWAKRLKIAGQNVILHSSHPRRRAHG